MLYEMNPISILPILLKGHWVRGVPIRKQKTERNAWNQDFFRFFIFAKGFLISGHPMEEALPPSAKAVYRPMTQCGLRNQKNINYVFLSRHYITDVLFCFADAVPNGRIIGLSKQSFRRMVQMEILGFSRT